MTAKETLSAVEALLDSSATLPEKEWSPHYTVAMGCLTTARDNLKVHIALEEAAAPPTPETK